MHYIPLPRRTAEPNTSAPVLRLRRSLRRMVAAGMAGLVLLTVAGLGGRSFAGAATSPTSVFRYGYDLSQQAPSTAGTGASASARRVMSSLPATLDDQAIMGWGAMNPEPSPGVFQLSSLASRISLVQATGGTPVITLCGAPDWMKGGTAGQTNWSLINVAPLPSHYEDFAALSAKIAEAFPQVKYFVVWNEFKGFWNASTRSWNYAGYTAMYNDVYRAIKAVRPDAEIGGPYAPLPTSATASGGSTAQTPAGQWGYLQQSTLTALSYWLAHKVGADFVAVDGSDVTTSGAVVGGPVVSTEKYAAADRWLKSQTSLPIWWMESHLEPSRPVWSNSEGAAVRVAALLEMAGSGASAGLQWQPQDQGGWSDIGDWTSTLIAGGGQATVLAGDMTKVLPVLNGGIKQLTSPVANTLVAQGPRGVVALNGSPYSVTLPLSGHKVTLGAYQVLVQGT